MPSSLKCAAVTLLLKKAGMDVEDMSSYRLISNLPFLSKLIEKVVARRIEHYIQIMIFMIDISLLIAKITQQRQLLLNLTVTFLIA